MLVAEAALLAWNAWHYDWLRGYDAFANAQYADVVSREYRLPSEAESGVWHTPPLWFALAGAMDATNAELLWSDFVETSIFNSNKVFAIFDSVSGSPQ